MKEEYKKTVIYPVCKNKVTLDKLGNNNEEYIQCPHPFCKQTFKNPYYEGGKEDARSYIG